jgi:hypothetical protein
MQQTLTRRRGSLSFSRLGLRETVHVGGNAGGRDEQLLERLLSLLNFLFELGGGLFVVLEFLAAGLDDD